jgi:hypothetical protein
VTSAQIFTVSAYYIVCAVRGCTHLHTAGLDSHICHGNYDESTIPLCSMREGRNGGAVGYTGGPHPDKLRPCNHWCGGQPVDETGSGQACGDEWWRRSGGATTPLRRVDRGVLTGSECADGPWLWRPYHACLPPELPTP